MKRKITKLPQVIYHGTTDKDEISFKSGIDLGKGFYATSSFAQATRWANLKASTANIEERKIINGKSNNKIIKPLIIKYKVDVERLLKLIGLKFENPDDEWAKFILENRLGECNIDELDYVYGHLADSRIASPIRDYKKGIIDFNGFCRAIQPAHSEYEDQICLRTYQSIECLERSD